MKNKSILERFQYAIWTDSGETYIDTGVKMLLAIVIGALLLTGIYGIFSDIILTNVSSTIQGFFDQTPTLNGGPGGNGGGNGSGGNNVPDPAGFPISWNSMDVVDNVDIYFEGDTIPYYVKVSDYTPTTEEMLMSKITFNGYSDCVFDEPYMIDNETTGFLCYIELPDGDRSFEVVVAASAGNHGGADIPEAGFYVTNIGGLYGENVDFVISLREEITFTIDGVEYQALEGMTWEEWIDSDYNYDDFGLWSGDCGCIQYTDGVCIGYEKDGWSHSCKPEGVIENGMVCFETTHPA